MVILHPTNTYKNALRKMHLKMSLSILLPEIRNPHWLTMEPLFNEKYRRGTMILTKGTAIALNGDFPQKYSERVNL